MLVTSLPLTSFEAPGRRKGTLPTGAIGMSAYHYSLPFSEAALTEKIQLLSLMEMVFKAPAHSRSLKFADIAATSRLKEEQVEHLVMRALSLGLVKGSWGRPPRA